MPAVAAKPMLSEKSPTNRLSTGPGGMLKVTLFMATLR